MSTFAIGFLVLYFLPTLIAVLRRAQHDWLILAVNMSLGWTFIGWFILLAWSASAEKRPSRAGNDETDTSS